MDSSLLTADRCDAFLRDPGHLFRLMWGDVPWTTSATRRCWKASRDLTLSPRPPQAFLDTIRSGSVCNTTNWLQGNRPRAGADLPAALAPLRHTIGRIHFVPNFTEPDAPALLGFDEQVHTHCGARLGIMGLPYLDFEHAAACVAANRNILWLKTDNIIDTGPGVGSGSSNSSSGKPFNPRSSIAYNLCRNLEWVSCAARGKLHGQRSSTLLLTQPMHALRTDGIVPLDDCRKGAGRAPPRCGVAGVHGYTSRDVFFLEACMLSKICSNGATLFAPASPPHTHLHSPQTFVCTYSVSGMEDLLRLLGAS